MTITMIMTMSLNGKTTRGENPEDTSWKSKEDQEFFYRLHRKNPLIVMGRKTYESVKKHMVFRKGQLRIVMTHHPESYIQESVPHILEFTDESPKHLAERMYTNGYKTMLLVGGGTTNTAFLKAGLVNEAYITIEPVLFGKGKPLVGEDVPLLNLTLIQIRRLNLKGTLLLHYSVSYL